MELSTLLIITALFIGKRPRKYLTWTHVAWLQRHCSLSYKATLTEDPADMSLSFPHLPVPQRRLNAHHVSRKGVRH